MGSPGEREGSRRVPPRWQGRFVCTELQKRTRVDKSGSLTSLMKTMAGCCVGGQFAERKRAI